jgi:hypothetical protein
MPRGASAGEKVAIEWKPELGYRRFQRIWRREMEVGKF